MCFERIYSVPSSQRFIIVVIPIFRSFIGFGQCFCQPFDKNHNPRKGTETLFQF